MKVFYEVRGARLEIHVSQVEGLVGHLQGTSRLDKELRETLKEYARGHVLILELAVTEEQFRTLETRLKTKEKV